MHVDRLYRGGRRRARNNESIKDSPNSARWRARAPQETAEPSLCLLNELGHVHD
jgi:hypothetical protein